MKVLIIVPSLVPKGPVRVFITLAKYLRLSGVNVDIWYFDDLQGALKESATKVNFWKKADFSSFNVIQSVGLRPDLFVRRNKSRNHQPCVTTMENYVEEDFYYEYGAYKAKIFAPIWKYAVQKHDKVVVLQEHMKEYYQNNWGLKNLEIIGNCTEAIPALMEPNVQSRILEFKGNRTLAASIGLVTNRKGLQQVAHLLVLMPSLVWVHLGDGKDMPQLKSIVNELGIKDRVLFLGNTPNASAYLKHANLFLMPSYSEGMPLAMLEAVMQELPCVSTNLPVFQAIFNNDQVGQFTPGDIEEFKSIVEHVLSAPKSYTSKALERYNQEYAPESVAAKYIELYTSLIQNHEG